MKLEVTHYSVVEVDPIKVLTVLIDEIVPSRCFMETRDGIITIYEEGSLHRPDRLIKTLSEKSSKYLSSLIYVRAELVNNKGIDG